MRISRMPLRDDVDDPYSGRYYARGFDGEEIDNLLDLAELVTKDVWSPCVWAGGARAKVNFQEASFWALDFDEGKTVLEVTDWAKTLRIAHIIGLTKSHQKPKKSGDHIKPACDRFRLIIPMHETITDIDTFEHNMKQAVAKFACDDSCTDGARYYFPCVDIAAIAPGRPIAWKSRPPAEPTTAERLERKRVRAEVNASRGVIPRWMQSLLREGTDSGGRHKACYKLGANLIHYGFTAQEIVSMCLDSPLAAIGENDVERAVRNGVARSGR